jgi:hypothetical protein
MFYKHAIFHYLIITMPNELIIQQLQEKETYLVNELNKVRLALQAFIDDNINFTNPISGNHSDEMIPLVYEAGLTYAIKILFVLKQAGSPMLVDEIAFAIQRYEPELELNRLHKSVSHTVSMLAKYGKVKKHPFARKIKYSFK